MKKITCKKPCTIGGERFAIGDDVPEKLIAPGREAALVKYGLISVEDVPEAPSAPVSTATPLNGGEDGQQPEDDQKEPEQSDTDEADTPDGGEKKTGKRGKK